MRSRIIQDNLYLVLKIIEKDDDEAELINLDQSKSFYWVNDHLLEKILFAVRLKLDIHSLILLWYVIPKAFVKMNRIKVKTFM